MSLCLDDECSNNKGVESMDDLLSEEQFYDVFDVVEGGPIDDINDILNINLMTISDEELKNRL